MAADSAGAVEVGSGAAGAGERSTPVNGLSPELGGSPAPRWLAIGAVMALALAVPASVLGEDEGVAPPTPVNWATLAYEGPAPTYRLRLGLQELFGVTAAVVGYSLDPPPPALPGLPESYPPWPKLAFRPGTWTFDADDYGTNMVGHVAAGTVYYLIARGNRVSIPEAFGWTFGASLLWELVEYREPVSINDMIMTPVGGVALGEAFSQLSSWFDRGGDDGLSWALAFLFSPARKLHDWIDGAVPDRDPRARGWHEFATSGGAGFLQQGSSGPPYPIVQLGIGTRLFRAPGYGEPGRSAFSWDDGNASRLGLGMTFGAGQVVDFLFDTETGIVGSYVRDLDGDGDVRHGHDLFLAGTVGYEYGLHRWNLRAGDGANRITLVRLPGLSLRARWFAGPWTVALGLDSALTFGGVQPFGAQHPFSLPVGSTLPVVYLVSGYYYAIGFRGAPSVEVRHGGAAAGVALWVDLLTGITQPEIVAPRGSPVRLDDQRWLTSAWVRWRVSEPGLEVGVVLQWRSRSGSVDTVRASEQERSAVGNLGVTF